MFDNLKPGVQRQGLWAARAIFAAQPSRGQVSVHFGRLRRDADDVDAALAERLRAMDRCRLRQLRAKAGGDHLPQGARAARQPHAGPDARLHDRGAVEPRGLVRPYGPDRRAYGCRCWRPIFASAKFSAAAPTRSCAPCGRCWRRPASTWRNYHQESFAAPAVEEIPAPFGSPAEVGRQAASSTCRGRNADPLFALGCRCRMRCRPDRAADGARFGRAHPAACEFGLCGTCKVKKVSGEVEMSHNGGILDRRDRRRLHPCLLFEAAVGDWRSRPDRRGA